MIKFGNFMVVFIICNVIVVEDYIQLKVDTFLIIEIFFLVFVLKKLKIIFKYKKIKLIQIKIKISKYNIIKKHLKLHFLYLNVNIVKEKF